jgi:hypothetical protein
MVDAVGAFYKAKFKLEATTKACKRAVNLTITNVLIITITTTITSPKETI